MFAFCVFLRAQFTWVHFSTFTEHFLRSKSYVSNPISTLLLATAAAAKSLQSCRTLCMWDSFVTPQTATHQASPTLGFSRQEHWSGLPFPSPVHARKSESEIAQSWPTLSDPVDCSLPGSSVHGIYQARGLEWLPLPSPTLLTNCSLIYQSVETNSQDQNRYCDRALSHHHTILTLFSFHFANSLISYCLTVKCFLLTNHF